MTEKVQSFPDSRCDIASRAGSRLARTLHISLLSAAAALGGCRRQEPAPAEAAASIVKDQYTVRGIVMQLPDPQNPALEFQVRHEAMPHFRGQDGELGMDTMTMAFPLTSGLKLDGLAVGDAIELRFEVDFDASTRQMKDYRATGFTKLDAGTKLDFTRLRK